MLLCDLKCIDKFSKVNDLFCDVVRSGDHPSIESKTGCSPVTLLKGIPIVDTFWLPYRTYSKCCW
jgi:hypothetical protein